MFIHLLFCQNLISYVAWDGTVITPCGVVGGRLPA
jgi:hypothetical protein